MAITVFAEGMGFFHKGSNGKGIAPGDVCLSPPPPPAGPVPVPYVNMLSASDLIKGSTSVKIDGNPTALESSSEVAMSTGNEPATPGLGAGVITHRIKGKGAFMLWSFTVKVEGKGVCRHGDPMGQNEASNPCNGLDGSALVAFYKAVAPHAKGKKKCPKYSRKRHAPDINAAQDKKVRGKPCWECGKPWLPPNQYSTASKGKYKDRDKKAMTPDHEPPMKVAWENGGCHMPKPYQGFKDHFAKPKAVKPHCRKCSNSQGANMKTIRQQAKLKIARIRM
ncbi:MAG: DUF4150 domain-containing protein [Mesorhizobium sp.]|uniref:DUF4150 domain-containing protein n=1 Tax=Mesorhizobium sp. TaxID=1871066 RepID=UPI000FE79731|nr:DUF4150 domain-containing protein [Mesorhizobium sp.]RWP87428.1 MAG: DUF4150 domain-containing protein [Mesorhizobium sp.]